MTSRCCSGCHDVAASLVASLDRMMRPRQRQTASTRTRHPQSAVFEVTHSAWLENRSLPVSMRASPCAMSKKPLPTLTRGPRFATTVPAAVSTGTPPVSWPPTSPVPPGKNWLPSRASAWPGRTSEGGGPNSREQGRFDASTRMSTTACANTNRRSARRPDRRRSWPLPSRSRCSLRLWYVSPIRRPPRVEGTPPSPGQFHSPCGLRER